ncbi:MAG: hypothetical protein IJ521_06050 [Schwartzia sp.]|nr:hypothetical protein [Schwartzia sp. (in: firmicutes)]
MFPSFTGILYYGFKFVKKKNSNNGNNVSKKGLTNSKFGVIVGTINSNDGNYGGDDMNAMFPNLIAEIAKRGIKKNAISSTLGISGKALYNKMRGDTPFTWDEVCKIQSVFFPDMDKDVLFVALDIGKSQHTDST